MGLSCLSVPLAGKNFSKEGIGGPNVPKILALPKSRGVILEILTIFRHGRQGSPGVSKVQGGPQGWLR